MPLIGDLSGARGLAQSVRSVCNGPATASHRDQSRQPILGLGARLLARAPISVQLPSRQRRIEPDILG